MTSKLKGSGLTEKQIMVVICCVSKGVVVPKSQNIMNVLCGWPLTAAADMIADCLL